MNIRQKCQNSLRIPLEDRRQGMHGLEAFRHKNIVFLVRSYIGTLIHVETLVYNGIRIHIESSKSILQSVYGQIVNKLVILD